MFQVVFVLSTNYAGSHLISQLLGAHPLCRSVGELHNYRKFRRRPDGERNVVNDFDTNPAFTGLNDLDEREWHRRIFDNLQVESPATTALIDNSKKPRWAGRFVGNGSFQSAYVHLIRDPRALVRRWSAGYRTTRARRQQRLRLARSNFGFAGTALWGSDVEVYLYKWLAANQQISSFLSDRAANSSLITYHDLVVDTARTLSELMPRLNLEFDTAQLSFGRSPQMGTYKRDYAALSEQSRIELDTRWKDELDRSQLCTIEDNRDVHEYLSELGLKITANGLTRI